jgi:hypothetical protein
VVRLPREAASAEQLRPHIGLGWWQVQGLGSEKEKGGRGVFEKLAWPHHPDANVA